MYSSKLLLAGLFSLIPVGSSIPFLLNDTNKLNQKAPHWNKLIEVWFYDKEGQNHERIKVWIEDLNNINKAEYWDNSKSNWSSIKDNKKYSYLAELAKYYLLTQHRINVISSFNWLNKEANDIKEIKCTKCSKDQCPATTELGCFLKCCEEKVDCDNKETIIQDQQIFAAYLTNLYSSWNYAYFQPIQAHIYLGEETTLNQGENIKPEPKKLTGTTVYGFVDYSYKEKDKPDANDYKKLIKNEKVILENKKYFINYPQTFSLEEGTNNLKKIHEELEKNKSLKKEEHNHENGECKNLQCLIASNYFKSLSELNQPFKDLSKCKKQK